MFFYILFCCYSTHFLVATYENRFKPKTIIETAKKSMEEVILRYGESMDKS